MAEDDARYVAIQEMDWWRKGLRHMHCCARLPRLFPRSLGFVDLVSERRAMADARVHIRTLVVEDIQFQRDMLKNLFTSSNVANSRSGTGVTYDVTFAEGGRQAQALLVDEKKQYDLILVDVLMPGVTGDKLLTKLNLAETCAVVMISVCTASPRTDAHRTAHPHPCGHR